MDLLLSLAPPAALAAALAITALAGVIKGMVGFAMPLIMIAGLSSVMEPSLALAALILPTLVTNLWQGLTFGPRAAWEIAIRFRLFLLVGAVFLAGSAQLVPVLDPTLFFLILGGLVLVFAATMLSGWVPRLPPQGSRTIEAGVGAISGFAGGLAGVWGPPTVVYLTALDLPRREHVATQSVIYALGAVALFAAHLVSGVITLAPLALSAALVVPAMFGMLIGQALMGRASHARFRQAVLWVLLLAAANLIRRGLAG
ncbi:MAG: sulfite exporter TauE/SafE family protein [Rubellimicrobium sp.]|nr:sulfite exporter TauE/SafE family protein [Rubellimicrobium sp.]